MKRTKAKDCSSEKEHKVNALALEPKDVTNCDKLREL